MKEDLIGDIWLLFVSDIPVKQRQTAASDYVNLLTDSGISENKLKAVIGVDPILDEAITSIIEADAFMDEDEYDDDDDRDDY